MRQWCACYPPLPGGHGPWCVVCRWQAHSSRLAHTFTLGLALSATGWLLQYPFTLSLRAILNLDSLPAWLQISSPGHSRDALCPHLCPHLCTASLIFMCTKLGTDHCNTLEYSLSNRSGA